MSEEGSGVRSAAFFDLDNTLVRGTSMIQVGKGLYARRYFKISLILRALWLESVFRATGREHEGHIHEARETILGLIRGRRVDELTADVTAIYHESIAARIWPQTRALAEGHLEAGIPVWLMTAAPSEVAEVAAQHLGLTGGFGTRAESRDGVYTGRLVDGLLHGPQKAVQVRRLADEHGYDLVECHAYSDSCNDLPMLELVGHPHVVNPDDHLLGIARERGWPVHEFRAPGRRRRAIVGATAVVGLGLGALKMHAMKVAKQVRP
ncbi:HAD family hydrolase [Mariniluteicoccus endophyticus]